MTLTPMQEILILLEDEKKVPLFRLNRWGRPARGALAKMKNMGFIKKEVIREETYYCITDAGEKYFDNLLAVLSENKKWDSRWRLVMFDIPEKNRATRDKLRRALTALGLGILQGSVWISSYDIKSEIDKISEKLNIPNSIRYFEVTASPALNEQIIEKSWNLPELNYEYEVFIKEGNRALRTMGKGNGDRFKAKTLIFKYALILKKDPKLPEAFIEQNILRKEAHDLYTKLRVYAN